MNKSEVKIWIDYHKSLFPEWDYASGTAASKKVAFAAYAKALLQVELTDATAASDRMLDGQIKKPFRNEDHLREIVNECRGKSFKLPQTQIIDGEKVYACLDCEDSGYKIDSGFAYRTVVFCHCKRGEHFQSRYEANGWQGRR